jgi:hypothetical protein
LEVEAFGRPIDLGNSASYTNLTAGLGVTQDFTTLAISDRCEQMRKFLRRKSKAK